MADKTAVEELGDLEFVGKMIKFFGTKRAVELFGYALVMGASGRTLPSELVAFLVGVGFSKSGVYRALADIKRFVREVEREGGHTMSMPEVFAEINAAGVSRLRESVV